MSPVSLVELEVNLSLLLKSAAELAKADDGERSSGPDS
jgi:hypothetical protein